MRFLLTKNVLLNYIVACGHRLIKPSKLTVILLILSLEIYFLEKHGDTNEPSPADLELKLIQSKKDIEDPKIMYTAQYIWSLLPNVLIKYANLLVGPKW